MVMDGQWGGWGGSGDGGNYFGCYSVVFPSLAVFSLCFSLGPQPLFSPLPPEEGGPGGCAGDALPPLGRDPEGRGLMNIHVQA